MTLDGVLVSQSCLSKGPCTGWLKATSLTVLDLRSLESGCRQARPPSKHLAASGVPWRVAVPLISLSHRLPLHTAAPFLRVLSSLSLTRTRITGSRAPHPHPYPAPGIHDRSSSDPWLNCIYKGSFFQIISPAPIPDIRTRMYLFGGSPINLLQVGTKMHLYFH